MSQSITQMAKDLVLAQIAVGKVMPENLGDMLQMTYAALSDLHKQEGGTSAHAISTPPQVDWKASIKKHSVTCLECGTSFRQLSLRHLHVHDLDPHSYRVKYDIPSTQPLSSREATARRRELAQQIRPWEQALAKRAATRIDKQPTVATTTTGAKRKRKPK